LPIGKGLIIKAGLAELVSSSPNERSGCMRTFPSSLRVRL
jgi:hypothetical protein